MPDEDFQVPWYMKRRERTGPIFASVVEEAPQTADNGWGEHYRALTDVPYVHRPNRITDEPGAVIPYAARESAPAPPLRPRPAVHYDPTPAIAASAAVSAATAAIIACS